VRQIQHRGPRSQGLVCPLPPFTRVPSTAGVYVALGRAWPRRIWRTVAAGPKRRGALQRKSARRGCVHIHAMTVSERPRGRWGFHWLTRGGGCTQRALARDSYKLAPDEQGVATFATVSELWCGWGVVLSIHQPLSVSAFGFDTHGASIPLTVLHRSCTRASGRTSGSSWWSTASACRRSANPAPPQPRIQTPTRGGGLGVASLPRCWTFRGRGERAHASFPTPFSVCAGNGRAAAGELPSGGGRIQLVPANWLAPALRRGGAAHALRSHHVRAPQRCCARTGTLANTVFRHRLFPPPISSAPPEAPHPPPPPALRAPHEWVMRGSLTTVHAGDLCAASACSATPGSSCTGWRTISLRRGRYTQ
jgi:hypothetical protein